MLQFSKAAVFFFAITTAFLPKNIYAATSRSECVFFRDKVKPFTEQIPVGDPRRAQLIAQGIDPNKVRIYTFNSIINGVLKKSQEAQNYKSLLFNIPEIRKRIIEFVNWCPVGNWDGSTITLDTIKDPENSKRRRDYRTFIYNTLRSYLEVQEVREVVVLILALTDYYLKNIDPNFKFYLCRGDMAPYFHCNLERQKNVVLLIMETITGKHPSELRAGVKYLTSQHLTNPNVHPNSTGLDLFLQQDLDISCLIHELDHIIRLMLKIDDNEVPYSHILNNNNNNNPLKAVLFPFTSLDKEHKMSIIRTAIEEEIKRGLGENFAFDLITQLITKIEASYTQELNPSSESDIFDDKLNITKKILEEKPTTNLLKKTKLQDICILKSKKINNLLSHLVELVCYHDSLVNFESRKELMIFLGIMPVADYIVVNNISEFDLTATMGNLIRWSYSSFYGNANTAGLPLDPDFIFLSPSILGPTEHGLKLLFSLHGLNYYEYKQKMLKKAGKLVVKKS